MYTSTVTSETYENYCKDANVNVLAENKMNSHSIAYNLNSPNTGKCSSKEQNLEIEQLPVTSSFCFFFVAFDEDNATMSSIRYFENHISYFVQNRRK